MSSRDSDPASNANAGTDAVNRALAPVPHDPDPFPPFRVTGSDRIYDSRWCGLRRDRLRLHDGSEQEHHVIEISDAVVVVPAFADGSITLIGQYRYPHGKTHWEVPAGRIGNGEAPLAAGLRELREEAGLASAKLVALPGFYPLNGISPHYAHAFAALECFEVGAPEPEASEQIVVRRFSEREVRALLESGRIQDGFTALALFHYFARKTA